MKVARAYDSIIFEIPILTVVRSSYVYDLQQLSFILFRYFYNPYASTYVGLSTFHNHLLIFDP